MTPQEAFDRYSNGKTPLAVLRMGRDGLVIHIQKQNPAEDAELAADLAEVAAANVLAEELCNRIQDPAPGDRLNLYDFLREGDFAEFDTLDDLWREWCAGHEHYGAYFRAVR